MFLNFDIEKKKLKTLLFSRWVFSSDMKNGYYKFFKALLLEHLFRVIHIFEENISSAFTRHVPCKHGFFYFEIVCIGIIDFIIDI